LTYHAPTHHDHESDKNVVPRIIRQSLQHLFAFWQSRDKSNFFGMGDVLVIKGPPFWFDTEMEDVPTTQGMWSWFNRQQIALKKKWELAWSKFDCNDGMESGSKIQSSKIQTIGWMFNVLVISLWNHIYGFT
jgi:hypothetical protein